MLEDIEELKATGVAERIIKEIALFDAAESVWAKNAKARGTYPRGYERYKVRNIMKDIKKGIRIIRKKNPLYIEMPTLKAVGDGYVKREYDKNYMSESNDNPDEIDVYTSVEGFIEDKKQ